MSDWPALPRADYGLARSHCQPLNVLAFGHRERLRQTFAACRDPQVFGANAGGNPAGNVRNGDYRSIAPFPAMIFGRNFSMRAIRVSGFLVELRWMT